MDTSRSLEPGAAEPSLLSSLMVEVFLARGATHHGDLHEAAAEFRELFARFGILTEVNDALIDHKVARLERRAGQFRLRLVKSGSPDTPHTPDTPDIPDTPHTSEAPDVSDR